MVDKHGNIIAGHGRLLAAIFLGLTEVPVIVIDGLTETQLRALVIAHNKVAENAGWDDVILAEELEWLISEKFDVETTGFEAVEIDDRIAPEDGVAARDAADECPKADGGMPVSQVGDFWALAEHRLLNGDALDSASYDRLLGGRKADVGSADPPYNVPILGHAGGLGRVKHREFLQASGEMSDTQFERFLTVALEHMTRHTRDGSIFYICMDWRGLRLLLNVAAALKLEVKNLCVWVKTNAGMGSFYRSQHEFVLVLKNGTAPHVNNVELGRKGRYRTNVWRYAGVNSFGAGRADAFRDHPTVKPVAMVADAIRDCSVPNDLVLDPFAGSGTTIIACERTKRRCAAIELDPLYVDVAIRRFQTFTGKQAVHVESGLTFEQMRAARAMSRETA